MCSLTVSTLNRYNKYPRHEYWNFIANKYSDTVTSHILCIFWMIFSNFKTLSDSIRLHIITHYFYFFH